MDRLCYLSDFFEAIKTDHRISITHIGIYAALLQVWSEHNFDSPLYAFSYDIMRVAKLSSAFTYHKCIRELNVYGYLKYEPSFDRTKGSRIYLFKNTNGVYN